MHIEIRTPKRSEYTFINNLISQAFKVQTTPIELSFFTNPNIHCLVAVHGKILLGTASLHIIQKSSRKMGLIEDVVVDPKTQGKGVGKKLVEQLLLKAAEMNCYKTILNATNENSGFYTKLGFQKEQLQFTIRH